MPPLDLIEQQSLQQILGDPICNAALKKLCANHDQFYTEKARQELNVVPEDLHSKARHDAQAKQYAAMAKAWGTAFAELEKAAGV